MRSVSELACPDEDRILDELVEHAEQHPEHALIQFRSLVTAHQYLKLYRLFRRYVPKGSKVLDWGAGNGHFSYFLQRSGYATTGYSIDEDFVLWLPSQAYSAVSGKPADPVTLPFADASFDAVSSVGVLEHVREFNGDEGESLREISRILKPGGTFVCFHFPNKFSWIDFVGRHFLNGHHHEFKYTRNEVRKLVSDAGLELLEVRRYAILPRNAWHLLPHRVRGSKLIARIYDAFDAGIGLLLSPICQNHLFVARMPENEWRSSKRVR